MHISKNRETAHSWRAIVANFLAIRKLTVESGVADAVPAVEEEVEADASGSLAADLERSGPTMAPSMQAQGRIMLLSHQHSVTMSTPGSLAQICS
jgi:hypothetical protein